MKKIYTFIFFLIFYSNAFAASFSLTMWDSISGNSAANIYYLYDFLTKEYKSNPEITADAYFFKGNKTFFGIKTEESFVSNGSSTYNFVGMTLIGPPDKIVKKLEKALGTTFIKVDPTDKYSKYIRRSGTELLWYGADKSRLIFKVENSNYKYDKNPYYQSAQ